MSGSAVVTRSVTKTMVLVTFALVAIAREAVSIDSIVVLDFKRVPGHLGNHGGSQMTIQSPERLYKAPTDYTKTKRDYAKTPEYHTKA